MKATGLHTQNFIIKALSNHGEYFTYLDSTELESMEK